MDPGTVFLLRQGWTGTRPPGSTWIQVIWQRGTRGCSLNVLKWDDSAMNLINQKLASRQSSSLWVLAKECKGSLSGGKSTEVGWREILRLIKPIKCYLLLRKIRIEFIPIKSLECISSRVANNLFKLMSVFERSEPSS